MRAHLPLALATSALLAGCDFSPFGSSVSGITEIDYEGNVLREDRRDWRLAGCTNGPSNPGIFLSPAQPNPTRGATAVSFTIERATRVTARLLDDEEHEVIVLQDGDLDAGPHRLAVRRQVDGRTLPEGIYRVRIEFGDAFGSECRTYGDVRFSDDAL